MNKRIRSDNSAFLSDPETAEFFGIGTSTARKIAIEADAVIRIGKIKRNDIAKMRTYIEEHYKG